MTGEDFVKLCYEEKEAILSEYFNAKSETRVAKQIQELMKNGTSKEELFELINLVLTENYYTLLLGLEGEASLGNLQTPYKLYDQNGILLNECGEIEEAAYRYFIEN